MKSMPVKASKQSKMKRIAELWEKLVEELEAWGAWSGKAYTVEYLGSISRELIKLLNSFDDERYKLLAKELELSYCTAFSLFERNLDMIDDKSIFICADNLLFNKLSFIANELTDDVESL